MNSTTENRGDLYDQMMQRMQTELGEKKWSLGFYIHLLLMAGSAVLVFIHGAWNILWAFSLFLLMFVVSLPKRLYWNWTERKLKQDAEVGQIARAVRWDYLSLTLDWLDTFLVFVASAFFIFALAGDSMSQPSKWICVGGFYTVPIVFVRSYPGYHWGNFHAWEQWTVVATILLSAFLPITAAWGVALQIAVALLSVPLACRWERAEIRCKVEKYYQEAKIARAMYMKPPAMREQGTRVVKMLFENLSMRWMDFAASASALITGFAWALYLNKPLAPLAVVPAFFLSGYSHLMLVTPMTATWTDEEIARRNIDVDLTKDFFDIRAFVMMLSLAVASIVVMWLGGRDVSALAAMSLLAVGACNITVAFEDKNKSEHLDGFVFVVYALALLAVVALRICGLRWWECLAPIPAIAYILPTFRWFFPRSGLRGAARRAAVAEMCERVKADIRSASEVARDEKREKRRLREERRIANIRRSQGN